MVREQLLRALQSLQVPWLRTLPAGGRPHRLVAYGRAPVVPAQPHGVDGLAFSRRRLRATAAAAAATAIAAVITAAATTDDPQPARGSPR